MIELPNSNVYIDDVTIGIDDNQVSHSSGGALNFGYVAPGGKSQTLIIQLRVNGVSYISNIRLALITAFTKDKNSMSYKYTLKDYIDLDVIPDNVINYNAGRDINSTNNMQIGNLNNIESQFVYLNYIAPNTAFNAPFITTYMWFFNHDKNTNTIENTL